MPVSKYKVLTQSERSVAIETIRPWQAVGPHGKAGILYC